MKQHFRFTNQKTMVTAVAALGLTMTLTAVSFMPRGVNGEFSLTSIQQQLDENTQQLKNHDARITNNEKDIKSLQDSTGTAPASDRVDVPTGTASNSTNPAPVSNGSTSAQSPQPATSTPPAPAVTLTSTEKLVCHSNEYIEHNYNIYADHFSDGTTREFYQDHSTPFDIGCIEMTTWQ